MSEDLIVGPGVTGGDERDTVVAASPCPPVPVSPLRGWWYLVRLCLQRQTRSHQMVWIALVLLAFTATVVGLQTAGGRWGMGHWRYPRRVGPTFQHYVDQVQKAQLALPGDPTALALQNGLLSATRASLEWSGVYVFSHWLVYSIFLSFLLPVWSLSFATEALGGERETRSLIWLLTRPLPRWSVFLAKFVALLPWALGLNLGGFAVLCLAAGRTGAIAFQLYWPAVVMGSLAFCSLFHLLGACFRRAAVLAIVYSFFLEIILGNMPGLMKRVSIGFYTRCIMFDRGEAIGMAAPKTSIYLPVDAATAYHVLLAITVGCLVVGMAIFSRKEYQDLT